MNLKEFMEKPDSLINIKEAAKCGSKEELKGFFVSRGVSVTDDEVEKLYALLSKTKVAELSDEELDGVTGGVLYYEITGCPNGHTKRYLEKPADMQNGVVDERCKKCKFVETSIAAYHCTKESFVPSGW